MGPDDPQPSKPAYEVPDLRSRKPTRKPKAQRQDTAARGPRPTQEQPSNGQSSPRKRSRRSKRAAGATGEMWNQLKLCTTMDRAKLTARLRREGQSPSEIASIAREIQAAVSRRAERAKAVPTVTYPPDLPVSERRDDIAAAIRDHQVVVVCGETGSGKTTQLPKICMELGRGVDGLIGHTQPRRIAARAVANRIAKELQTPLGGVVGHKVRFDDRTSAKTILKLMTDGVLLAETQHDRLLRRYDTIIVDEAHERSLNIDFLLGYLKRLLPTRPDLKVIITSATIDTERFAGHFGIDGKPAPVVQVSGRMYPVETRYRPIEHAVDGEALDRDVLASGIVAAIEELDAHPGEAKDGDVLVFLPGEREIRDATKAIRDQKFRNTEVLPLYSRLAATDQDRVFDKGKGAGRRIVLATNIAETSITVPGIRAVIDPGLVRMSRYSTRSRIQRLPVEAISKASADQRKGRCGRIGPGVCIRLYEENDFNQRPGFTDPEILRTNLASVILQMKALRLGRPEDFPFLEPPRSSAIREGEQTLIELGALDADGHLTEMGQALARLPIDPRLGRMILGGAQEGCLREILVIASALSIQDPRERPSDRKNEADRAHEQWRHEGSDFLSFLLLWDWYHKQHDQLGMSKVKKLCIGSFVNFVRMREWVETHRQLADLAKSAGLPLEKPTSDPDAIHRALLTGSLLQIGYRTGKFEYEGPGGSSFFIFPGSALFEEKPRWVMAAEIVETERRFARTLGPIQPKWIEQLGEHLIQRHHSDPRFDARKGKVFAKERTTLSGLTITSGKSIHYGPIDPPTCRELFIYHGLVREEWETSGKFLAHNRALMEEIEEIEAKRRKRDVLVDFVARYEFYDQRIPQDIYTGESFESWRTKAEQDDPALLLMTAADLMQGDAEEDTATRFPDAMPVGGSDMPLSYTLDPGSTDDGVTLTVPVEALAHLGEEATSWLVPGLVEEKIIALIRGLPKGLRRSFLPTPQIAKECAKRIAEVRGEKPFVEAVTDALLAMTGVEVPLDLWPTAALPDHLRMKIRVIDESGDPLAEGRDIVALRRELAPQMRTSFETMSDDRWNRTGIVDWDFGDLPDLLTIQRGDVELKVTPALVDEGKSSRMRLFESPQAAERAHRGGMRRLFMLRARDELNYHARYLPNIERMALNYATIGPIEELKADLRVLLADCLFVGQAPPVRTQQAFDRRLDAAWHRIGETTHAVCELTDTLLSTYQRVRLAVENPPKVVTAPAKADLVSQLRALIYPGFLAATPITWLSHYPRYLQAIQLRIDRAGRDGGDRDAQRHAHYHPYWAAYVKFANGRRPDELPPSVEKLRWMIEEWRVSLFAQELGTAETVSEKRIKKQWDECQREIRRG